ncbi:MAG: potassium channel protein [Pyrinomonadaceae bacterium]
MSLLENLLPDLRRRLIYAMIAIVLMLAFGTIGFHYIEDLSWSESLYFTTTTLTTVGYGDIVPQTRAGRQFTTVFVLVGVGTVLYALSVLAQAFIQDEILGTLGIRRRTKEMENLSNHYIICGAGRVGRRMIRALNRQNIPFVVIEIHRDRIEQIEESERAFVLTGDATLENNLRKAGVERARGLATCLSDDAQNVYVALTARDLNKNLHIVSRAVEEEAEPKLIRAGANRVVSPIIIGSQSMARALIKPAIADFMDSIIAENLDLVFEEIRVSSDSKYIDMSLMTSNIRNEFDILIVAIRRNDGEMIFNPSGKTKILEGDLMIVIGKAESVQKFSTIT